MNVLWRVCVRVSEQVTKQQLFFFLSLKDLVCCIDNDDLFAQQAAINGALLSLRLAATAVHAMAVFSSRTGQQIE